MVWTTTFTEMSSPTCASSIISEPTPIISYCPLSRTDNVIPTLTYTHLLVIFSGKGLVCIWSGSRSLNQKSCFPRQGRFGKREPDFPLPSHGMAAAQGAKMRMRYPMMAGFARGPVPQEQHNNVDGFYQGDSTME